MLTPDLIKAINEAVYKQPKTITEISQLAKCSWITANKYIEYISEKYGTIKIKVFRGGTRGALKIVYWANFDGMRASTAQQVLLDKIKVGRKKQDFNPFDIFSLVDENKKRVLAIPTYKSENQRLVDLFRNASRQIFIFSGNISFINNKESNTEILQVLTDLARKRINIKILCRVDIASIKNIKRILEINKIVGYDAIDVRHSEQPLRGCVIDNTVLRLREEKKKEDYEEGELVNDLYILYDINDKDWIEWSEKVFWNLHANALPIDNRLKDLEKIEDLMINLK